MNIRLTALTSLCLVNLLGPLVDRVEGDAAPSGLASQPGTGFRLGPSPPPEETATTPPPPKSSVSWLDDLLSMKVPLTFGIIAAESSSDNIFYQPKGTSDFITEISPFLTLTLGHPINQSPTLDQETIDDVTDAGDLNYLHITARPIITLYAKNSNLNVVDQYEDAIYAHQFSKFNVSVEQKYEKLSQPTVQETLADTLINRDIYTTVVRTSYIYSDKLSTYGTAKQVLSDYKTNLYTNSTEWTAEYYFLYQFFPKLSLGLGPKLGFVDVSKAPSQRYERLLVHAFYPATGKLGFVLAAGAEVREFQDDSKATSVSPVLEAQAHYQPFDSMTITLNASQDRIVSNSQIGQDYTTSLVSLSVRQRFLQVVYLTLGGTYESDQYTGGVDGSHRNDNIYFGQANLEWASKNWLIVDAGYQFTRDQSSINGFTFDENRFTVSATLKY